ncbi:uncharacterized protein LOC131016700 [Salvia miltiorrhiza]|uniref:uncharacterized protein LOC131016700 n=1 Tax=Salvia miltiorrhiza TaxID=226208 RepID=UPI0025ACACEC|nr:uncharacterized protein LOC131016700 [Salvia miltiorrhiza]
MKCDFLNESLQQSPLSSFTIFPQLKIILRLKIAESIEAAMDIRLRIGSLYSHTCLNLTSNSKFLKPRCARGPPPQQNDDNSNDDKFSRDWDKAWSSFKKKGKKTLFSGFSPDKYVSWNPRRSEYPLSEEVDPIKRSERSNLMD